MWDKSGNTRNCSRRNLRCLNIAGVFNLLVNVKDSYTLHTEGNKEPGRLTQNLTDILNTEYQDSNQ